MQFYLYEVQGQPKDAVVLEVTIMITFGRKLGSAWKQHEGFRGLVCLCPYSGWYFHRYVQFVNSHSLQISILCRVNVLFQFKKSY